MFHIVVESLMKGIFSEGWPDSGSVPYRCGKGGLSGIFREEGVDHGSCVMFKWRYVMEGRGRFCDGQM